MKALIHHLRIEAWKQGSPNGHALEALADQLEEELKVLEEAAVVQHSIQALRVIHGIVARVEAEYSRIGLPPLFHPQEPVKVPVRHG